MKRPATLLLTGAMVAAGAAWYPIHAAAALCGQPSVTGVSPQVATAGATVTITGSNFANLLCTTSVSIGGVSPSQNPTVSSNGTSITFSNQPAMNGGILVTETGVGGSNVSNSNIAFYTIPTVSGLSTATPTAGQGVTVSGHGFNLNSSNDTRLVEHVAAAYLVGSSSTACAGASAGLSSDTAIAVSAPGHYCDGNLALSVTAPGDLGNPSGSQIPVYSGLPGHIDVQASGMTLSNTTATAGGTVSVTGSGFGTGGSATLGGAAVTPSGWNDTSVALPVPDTSVSNSAVALTRAADNAAIAVPGTVTVDARADSIAPTSAAPGATVTVSGGGFGTHPGTVSLASANATVTSWSPTSITFTVPAAGQSGPLTITPVDTGPPATEPSLTVTHPVSLGVGSGSPGSTAKPLSPAQVQQVTQALNAPPPPLPKPVVGGTPPPIPPSHPTNGPVALSLKTAAATAKPGKTVPFTVTLLAYGRAVASAPVQMVVAYEPAPDALITPASGVTNAKGQFHGVIRLSRTAGEMIVLARSGEFSDEVRLIGSNATAAELAAGQQSGSSALQNTIPYAIVGFATLLLLVGIALRVGLYIAAKDSVRAALIRERVGGLYRRVRGLLPGGARVRA